MAVLLETSKGDIVVDLFVEDCPVTCKNFLKLCKIKYYNNCLFHNVQRNFLAQTGDPTGTGKGGCSVYGVMYGEQARFFDDEIWPKRKHKSKGTLAMASSGENTNASQFYITLADSLDSLDEKHTVFGEVAEGVEVLEKINEAYVDEKGRPYQNIRIRHTIILEDPFDDPPQLAEHVPDASPDPQFEEGDRLEDDWVPTEDTRPPEEVEQAAAEQEAFNRAVVLEMVGDLPDAEVKPPSNMLFICKLNPVTTEEDLEIIFSRFGNVTSCDIIQDYKTGDSLCYGFIGFTTEEACEEAYFKMNNVLIDDRRIKVDFSQSVYHIWKQFRKFGRKGNANMGMDANDHQRRDRTALGDHLELKQSRGGPAGGSSHGLLPGDDDGHAMLNVQDDQPRRSKHKHAADEPEKPSKMSKRRHGSRHHHEDDEDGRHDAQVSKHGKAVNGHLHSPKRRQGSREDKCGQGLRDNVNHKNRSKAGRDCHDQGAYQMPDEYTRHAKHDREAQQMQYKRYRHSEHGERAEQSYKGDRYDHHIGRNGIERSLDRHHVEDGPEHWGCHHRSDGYSYGKNAGGSRQQEAQESQRDAKPRDDVGLHMISRKRDSKGDCYKQSEQQHHEKSDKHLDRRDRDWGKKHEHKRSSYAYED